ncbi:MAG: cytidylate kinase family protein [bacterium]|nr:cytidylate kinase family protein [bacterium]
MIITISGMPGAGKSTIGRLLAKKLGYKFYSMGGLRGEMAKSRGLTIDELNKLGESQEWTDKKVDEYQRELGKNNDNFVIDGWISFYFIPHSFKLFFAVNQKVGAERIFKDQRDDEKKVDSAKAMEKMLKARVKQTDKRYHKYYNVSFQDKKNFDLIIDTTKITPQQGVEIILQALANKAKVLA